jgi:hypothetical protein
MLTPESPAEDLLAWLTVQQQGFGEIAGDPPSQVDDLCATLAEDGAFLARSCCYSNIDAISSRVASACIST